MRDRATAVKELARRFSRFGSPLSLGCATLLYLVMEEVLVDAHTPGETTLRTAMFFVGFLAFLMLGMLD